MFKVGDLVRLKPDFKYNIPNIMYTDCLNGEIIEVYPNNTFAVVFLGSHISYKKPTRNKDMFIFEYISNPVLCCGEDDIEKIQCEIK